MFSIIIPYKTKSNKLSTCLAHIDKQTYKDYEIILLPDKGEEFKNPKIKVIVTGPVGPARKRDLGAKQAKGKFLAFIDDDAYPSANWLKKAEAYFRDSGIAAVCGPGVTPKEEDIFHQAGGWVNSLWFGSGGAGNYRFVPKKKRYVDDYPSMNFIIRKEDFVKVGGFDTHFWPGEDTKLCHDVVYGLGKKIIYDPEVLVYHHRRPLFLPHLRQISRYAVHRGHFARVLPQTSLKLGYLAPTLFVLFLISGPIINIFIPHFYIFHISVFAIYLILLFINVMIVFAKTGNLLLSVLTGMGIFLTHVTYGVLFPFGYFKKSLNQ